MPTDIVDFCFAEQPFVTQCQPLQVYQLIHTVCECTGSGRWRSESCQKVFKFMQTKRVPPQKKLQVRVSCDPGNLYVIGCNVCVCSKEGLIDETKCSNRRCVTAKTGVCQFGDLIRRDDKICACSDANVFLNQTCVEIGDRHIQPVQRGQIFKLLNLERSWLQEECIPNQEYWIDCNKCTCDKFGSLQCTNDDCVLPELEADTTFRRKFSHSLPKLKDENQSCTPGNTYRVHCNTCVCSAIGKLHCTTMVCWDQIVDSIEPL